MNANIDQQPGAFYEWNSIIRSRVVFTFSPSWLLKWL